MTPEVKVKRKVTEQLKELGYQVSATSIANYYRDFIDGFVIDNEDREAVTELEDMDIKVKVCHILMHDLTTKIELAKTVLKFSSQCAKSSNKFRKNS